MKKLIFEKGGLSLPMQKRTLILLVILISMFKTQAKGFSQDKKISLNYDEIKLGALLIELERISDKTFLYNVQDIDLKEEVVLHEKEKSLEEILEGVFKGRDLNYKIKKDHVVLFPWNVEEDTNKTQVMNAASVMQYQQQMVTGTVTDSDGLPLPGVNITVEGTTRGTQTDFDGKYEIEAEEGQILKFSSVGFADQEITIGEDSQIDVVMDEGSALDEVVIVGYGKQKKATVTGSVSSVKGIDIQKNPVANVSNSLGGRLPGVITTTGSGEPGYDDSEILIRGQQTLNDNSPLVVIDGIPSTTAELGRINPQDIDDINVLKDASAAIYGSQAANGVILVTTKRGSKGKPQITIDFNQGFVQPTRTPKMADAATYLQMLNEIDMYSGVSPRRSQDEIDKYRNIESQDPWLYHNTDWFSEALKSLSTQTRADVSMSGGSENFQYRVSMGALTEDGYYRNSSTRFNQYNFRSNIDGTISDNISLRFDVSGRYEDKNYPMESAGTTFSALMRGKPHLPAFWPNGMPGPAIERGENPVVTGTDATGHDSDDWYYLRSNLQLDIKIPGVEGLSVRGTFSYDKSFRERSEWITPWILYDFNAEDYEKEGGDPEQYLSGSENPPGQDPQLTESNENNYKMLLNTVAEYNADFGDHSLDVIAGVERRINSYSNFNAFRRHYISTAVNQLFAGSEKDQSNDGSASREGWLSYFGRINYDYQGKYLIGLIGRYDGSFKFPKHDRFGFFPSVSIGWRLSEEGFFRDNISFFNELKIRGSWGQTGNDRIDPYQFLRTYGIGEGYVMNGEEVISISQTRTPNPAITWEVANQRNIGIEGSILNRRLSFEIDYFNNLRKDILTQRNASVPKSSGLSLPEENIGEVQSYGVDGNITWRQDVNDDFNYSVGLNLGWATNKIKYWDEPPGAPDWQKSTGFKMNTDLYYVADGIFRDEGNVESRPHWSGARPGDVIFKDIDGDGEITADDRVRMNRNNIPEWTGGLTINARYKQFDLSMFFQGAAGASQYIRTSSGEFGNYLQDFANKRWTPDNIDAKGPRAFNREEEYWIAQNNTYFYRNTDYIRFKNLELGYNFPESLVDKWGIQNLRIYVSGYNLLTWDSFKVMDPESSSEGGAFYPQKRVLNTGITLTF